MFELLEAGGWLMWPIIVCSVVALAIIFERFWTLRTRRVLPRHLVPEVWRLYKEDQLNKTKVHGIREASPLGAVLAAGLVNRDHGREVMKESIAEAGRHVVHELERFLSTLGTIASISPLLGLLGTVFGMIEVFSSFMANGVRDPSALAGGIAEALITTAAGLSVAIPSLIFYRFFQGRVEDLVLKMEDEALKLIEVMHGEREEDA